MKVNGDCLKYAKSLIASGKINTGAWSFSSADGNKLLGTDKNDWEAYGKVHLAIDPDAQEETKAYYKYPIIKDGEVYTKALSSAQGYATKNNADAIAAACETLSKAAKDKMGDAADDPDDPDDPDTDELEPTNAQLQSELKNKNEFEGDSAIKRVHRIDSIDVPSWMVQSFSRTSEGFLRGRAIVTSIGVFSYMNADGTIRKELRLPDNVFNMDSLDSMRLKPLTLDHPPELVNSKNVKKYAIGNVGDNPNFTTQWNSGMGWNDMDDIGDGIHVAIDLIVQDDSAIDQVLSGKAALSCGYTCDLLDQAGVYLGVPYDAIQTNIRYNHVAIVDAARAGDAAKITVDRMDSAASVLQHVSQNQHRDNRDGRTDPMKEIILDGVKYDAEAKVIEALTLTSKRADAAEAKVAELTPQLSKLQADFDMLKSTTDAAEKVRKDTQPETDQARIDAAVESRLGLYTQAQKVGAEIRKDAKFLPEATIKAAVISKAFPKISLDGKDAAYVQACFDRAVEILEARTDADSDIRSMGDSLGDETEEGMTLDGITDPKDKALKGSATHRQDMIDRMYHRGKYAPKTA